MLPLILGSSSPARRTLLQRLNLDFSCVSPDIDETLLPGESAYQAVTRLALKKAEKVSQLHPGSLIIACDQLLTVNQTILGKPHTHRNAVNQLKKCSKECIHSYTGLVLLNSVTQNTQRQVVEYQVKFKELSNDTIERYLQCDQPYHCAGSIKAESLGPTLFEWMRGDDPSALIGLPLIQLNNMLLQENVDALSIS